MTFDPIQGAGCGPEYWAALLWHRMMGTTVFVAGESPAKDVAVDAHCLKEHPGGVALLALNLSRTEAQAVTVPQDSMRYTLTATELMGRTVELNGRELLLDVRL